MWRIGAGNVTADVLYAAFGSNLHPRRLQDRLPAATPLGSACLPGWSLHFNKRSEDTSGKCNILPHGDGVHLAIYSLSAADKRRLDKIEGVGLGYETGIVEVPGFGVCATYFAADTHVDDTLVPYDWYRKIVLLGCRWHAFPQAYIDGIAALVTAPDPDPERSRKNWATVARLRAAG